VSWNRLSLFRFGYHWCPRPRRNSARVSVVLAREFKVAERTYGADHLDLVLATGYISKLLRNGRVVGYLAKHYQELLFEVQKMTDAEVKAFHDDKRFRLAFQCLWNIARSLLP
jgi:hypothetical protein